MDYHLGDVLGKGAFGTVYSVIGHPDLAIKVSSQTNSCRSWSNEYEKIKAFMKEINKYEKLEYVSFLDPLNFYYKNETHCYMVMPRIYRPPDADLLHKNLVLQAQFGWNQESHLVNKTRGEFIGLPTIKKYIPPVQLKIMCYQLGLALGLLHFIGKNDGYDVELFLGREYNSTVTKVYFADFDLSEAILNYDKETKERMLWTLDSFPYFPHPSVDTNSFEEFKRGYIQIASIVKHQDIATEVMKEYVKD